MKRQSQRSSRGRLASAAFVIGSVVAVMASPLATGAATAATTEHYASGLSAPTASPSATVMVGTLIAVTTTATDGSFSIPGGPGGNVNNGFVNFTVTSGVALGQGCSYSYTGAGTYSCFFESDTAGPTHIAVSFTSPDPDIPNFVTSGIDLTWTPGVATRFVWTGGPSSVGLPDAGHVYTVTAEDQFGNRDTNFPEGFCSVDITNSDGTADSPINFVQGIGATLVQFTNPGTATLTASLDSPFVCSFTGGPGGIPNAQTTVAVNAHVTHFDVTATTPVTAGSQTTVTVTAKDAIGNTVPSFNSATTLSNTCDASNPALSFTNGVATVNATLVDVGTCHYTATSGSITGTSNNIVVNPAAATHLVLTAPANATAGTPVNVHVVAEDAPGNTATGYNGTVHFSNTPGHTCNAVLPANTQLVNGETTVQVAFHVASSSCEVTATDVNTGSINGTSNNVNVTAAGPDHLSVTASPTTITAGQQVGVTVTVLDAFGNPTNGDSGDCVNFNNNDGTIGGCFTAISGSSASFNVPYFRSGTHHVTVTVNGLSADSNNITVVAAAATHLLVRAQSTVHRGTAITMSVEALDQYGNDAITDNGFLSFASNDPNAVLPANGSVELTSGSASFDVTFFRHATNDAVRVFDTTHGIQGQSNPVNVI